MIKNKTGYNNIDGRYKLQNEVKMRALFFNKTHKDRFNKVYEIFKKYGVFVHLRLSELKRAYSENYNKMNRTDQIALSQLITLLEYLIKQSGHLD